MRIRSLAMHLHRVTKFVCVTRPQYMVLLLFTALRLRGLKRVSCIFLYFFEEHAAHTDL